jgi:uncharacterized protein (TIGR03790 family)
MSGNDGKRSSLLLLTARALFLCCSGSLLPATAAGPDNVLVIVNAQSGASRSIGDYYARKRGIPRKNVCLISAADEETISRPTYNDRIAAPIAACLKSRGLVETILYIVTTQGVPLRVKGRIGQDGDNASVDSELTLLYSALRGRPHPVDGPIANPFFRQRDANLRRPQFPIYLVTRLAAYDLAQVKSMIDRSLIAKNAGMFVLDLREGQDRGGDQWLRNAAILLPRERVLLEETNKVVYHQKRVIGYAAWGSNDTNRKQRDLDFEWLPGAIATEFVSTNGRTFRKPPPTWNIGTWSDSKTWFAGSPQSMAADFIAAGATGASGHVDEPYLGHTPRPDYLLPAYQAGRNLAESFYISIPSLSWQNIVLGDPLCTLGVTP